MILAIFGPAATGKTTIARALREASGLPLRSCGDAVRDKAKLIGVSWAELAWEYHKEVDEQTRSWTTANPTSIVEGRFLDYVLAPIRHTIFSVRLQATDACRAHRLTRDQSKSYTISDIRVHDARDLEFVRKMYDGGPRLLPSLEFNTSEQSVEACLAQLLQTIGGLNQPLA